MQGREIHFNALQPFRKRGAVTQGSLEQQLFAGAAGSAGRCPRGYSHRHGRRHAPLAVCLLWVRGPSLHTRGQREALRLPESRSRLRARRSRSLRAPRPADSARGAPGEAPLGSPASPGRSGASSQRVSTLGFPVAVTGQGRRSDAGTQRAALRGAEPRAGFRRGKRTWEERHPRDRVRFKLAGGSFKPGPPGAPFPAALADR